MVIAHDIQKWLEDRRRKRFAAAREEGLEEGLEKGRAEERSLWLEWLARKEDAESRGDRFTEPPPNGKV